MSLPRSTTRGTPRAGARLASTSRCPFRGPAISWTEGGGPRFMRKLCDRGVVVRAAGEARFLVVVVVLGLLGLGPLADASARAQEPDRGPAASATGVGSARVTDGGDEADGSNPTELDGPGGTSR